MRTFLLGNHFLHFQSKKLSRTLHKRLEARWETMKRRTSRAEIYEKVQGSVMKNAWGVRVERKVGNLLMKMFSSETFSFPPICPTNLFYFCSITFCSVHTQHGLPKVLPSLHLSYFFFSLKLFYLLFLFSSFHTFRAPGKGEDDSRKISFSTSL